MRFALWPNLTQAVGRRSGAPPLNTTMPAICEPRMHRLPTPAAPDPAPSPPRSRRGDPAAPHRELRARHPERTACSTMSPRSSSGPATPRAPKCWAQGSSKDDNLCQIRNFLLLSQKDAEAVQNCQCVFLHLSVLLAKRGFEPSSVTCCPSFIQPQHRRTTRQGPLPDVGLIRTWRRRKSSFNLGETSGMPMWLGVNDEPMSCTDFKVRVQ